MGYYCRPVMFKALDLEQWKRNNRTRKKQNLILYGISVVLKQCILKIAKLNIAHCVLDTSQNISHVLTP